MRMKRPNMAWQGKVVSDGKCHLKIRWKRVGETCEWRAAETANPAAGQAGGGHAGKADTARIDHSHCMQGPRRFSPERVTEPTHCDWETACIVRLTPRHAEAAANSKVDENFSSANSSPADSSLFRCEAGRLCHGQRESGERAGALTFSRNGRKSRATGHGSQQRRQWASFSSKMSGQKSRAQPRQSRARRQVANAGWPYIEGCQSEHSCAGRGRMRVPSRSMRDAFGKNVPKRSVQPSESAAGSGSPLQEGGCCVQACPDLPTLAAHTSKQRARRRSLPEVKAVVTSEPTRPAAGSLPGGSFLAPRFRRRPEARLQRLCPRGKSPPGQWPASVLTQFEQNSKVTVLGAGGGIGQPLSLLMKLNPRVSELALYDIKGAPGVAADVGHINTNSVVKGYDAGEAGLKDALTGSEIVLIPAGVPRKPGMTRDDLFNTNASIVRDLAKAAATAAPKANILVISNPVNSTVPICAEVFKAHGVYDPKRLFGVTTLDVVRASRFISQNKSTDPANENITVVGGHSGATIVPLLSQSGYELSGEALDKYVNRVQFGGDEVVQAKGGAGSATLSMAMAGARFAESLLKAAQGEKGVVEPTFVDSPLYKDQGIDFFASRVELGPNGVENILPVGDITPYEQKLLDACLKDLKGNIAKGVQFVKENP
ncbi:hypothetical protein FH972_021355 [Carpinus fangiana]|uniref:malate dehydrogenase n=1 Tax=Carpinus fangiana TaxID=176857 RepID=A0A5N6KP66_9ROSI|nr:hypothetical protein FH972_021355 [Carpinus fangiana]